MFQIIRFKFAEYRFLGVFLAPLAVRCSTSLPQQQTSAYHVLKEWSKNCTLIRVPDKFSTFTFCKLTRYRFLRAFLAIFPLRTAQRFWKLIWIQSLWSHAVTPFLYVSSKSNEGIVAEMAVKPLFEESFSPQFLLQRHRLSQKFSFFVAHYWFVEFKRNR